MRISHTLCLLLLTIGLVISCGSKNDQSGQTPSTDSTTLSQTPSQTGNAPSQKVTPPKPVVTRIMMPESTAIVVTLIDSIDTDIDPVGKKFKARLSNPVVVNGTTLFAAGALAEGVLDKVIESGRLKTPAEIEYHLTAIQNQDGDWIDVNTYVIHEKHGSHTTREAAMIGGGALAGGIIGTATGKKGGTIIGTAAGAAAGTAAAALTGKKDIVYHAGTEIVFILRESQQIAVE